MVSSGARWRVAFRDIATAGAGCAKIANMAIGIWFVGVGLVIGGLVTLAAATPHQDRRFKTGYKDNATVDAKAFRIGVILAIVGLVIALGSCGPCAQAVMTPDIKRAPVERRRWASGPDMTVAVEGPPDMAHRRKRHKVKAEAETPAQEVEQPAKVEPGVLEPY